MSHSDPNEGWDNAMQNEWTKGRKSMKRFMIGWFIFVFLMAMGSIAFVVWLVLTLLRHFKVI